MKKILFIFVILMWGCTKIDIPTPDVVNNTNIFGTTESKVVNAQSIYFNLPSAGVYTLSLIDKESGQVISRERFTGTAGENIRKIYTNSIQSQYLYLLLEDVTKKEIGKTTIIIR
jgi:hypothetical protein